MPEIEQGNRTASSSEPILQGTMDPAIFRGYQQLSALPQIVVMENWALCRGSNLSRSCDSQELCSYGGRMLSFVGLFAYWGSSSALLGLHSSWVAVGSLLGLRVADREAEAGEKKERDFFTENCLTDCLGQSCFIETSTQQTWVRDRFLEKDRLVWWEKKEGYNLAYTYMYSKTRGGWFCPCCDCRGITRVKLWTHDV